MRYPRTRPWLRGPLLYPEGMTALLTPAEMATWTQTAQETIEGDPYATEVNEKLGAYIQYLAGNADWTPGTVPIDVKMLAIRVVRRTYTNPDSEVQTGVGPLSSRVLDEAALAAALTESEKELLESKRADGGPDGLWTRGIGGSTVRLPDTIHVADDSGSDWMIPYLDINDVAVQDSDFPVAP